MFAGVKEGVATVDAMSQRARRDHASGDVVYLVIQYRGAGHFAVNPNAGRYVVIRRMLNGEDFYLAHWRDHAKPVIYRDTDGKLTTAGGWDLIAHAQCLLIESELA